MLSIVPIRIPIAINAIPLLMLPEMSSIMAAGIHITGGPIMGRNESIAATKPQNNALGIPKK